MTSLITGATGVIGRALLQHLGGGHILTRNVDKARSLLGDGAKVFRWRPTEETPPPEAFEGVTRVFHLAGESIGDGRWSDERKKRIVESRTLGTRNLVDGMRKLSSPPSVLVSSSAIGYYGDQGDAVLTESSASGEGFLSDICVNWEAEANKASALGVRVVCMRTGILLDAKSGALGKMVPVVRAGVGGKLGNGQQFMSWIHRQDLVNLLCYAADNDDIKGPVNGVAPRAASNAEFTKALAKTLGRWAIFPAPAFGIRLVFGEMAQLVLQSQNVVPQVALDHGFEFQFPTLSAALEDTLSCV